MKNIKKVKRSLCALGLAVSLSGVLAGTATAANLNATAYATAYQTGKLTKEQKADIEMRKARYKEMQEKFDALPQTQKDEIYALKDMAISVESQIIDKYTLFGIIDAQTANEIKQNYEVYRTKLRETGRLPFWGRTK